MRGKRPFESRDKEVGSSLQSNQCCQEYSDRRHPVEDLIHRWFWNRAKKAWAGRNEVLVATHFLTPERWASASLKLFLRASMKSSEPNRGSWHTVRLINVPIIKYSYFNQNATERLSYRVCQWNLAGLICPSSCHKQAFPQHLTKKVILKFLVLWLRATRAFRRWIFFSAMSGPTSSL